MSANEQDYGELHEVIVKYVTKKAQGALDDIDLKFDPGTEEIPATIPRTITASELAIGVALLKNSNITCKRNVGSALDELDAILKKSGKAKPNDQDIAAAMDAMEFTQAH